MKIHPIKSTINDEYHSESIAFYFDNWNIVNSLNDCDIIVASHNGINLSSIDEYEKLDPSKILMIMCMGSNHNVFTPEYFSNEDKKLKDIHRVHEKTLIVHTNLLDDRIDPKRICFDIMFNRQKLFCTEYNDYACRKLDTQWCRGFPESTFKLNNLTRPFNNKNKHFLAPIRLLPTSKLTKDFEGAKIRLRDFINKNISKITYTSDPWNGIFLKPNGWDDNQIAKDSGMWCPVGDQYYDTSYVSIVPETLTDGFKVFGPCEKSFDPLIKGHFLIPFSVMHMVKRLKEIYGFKFPDWIDYSYDNIPDYDERFNGFLDSIKKVAEISIEELHILYMGDKHILEHNRNVFYNRPYDRLLPKVKESIQSLGW